MKQNTNKYTEALRHLFSQVRCGAKKAQQDAAQTLTALELVNRGKYKKYIRLEIASIAQKAAKGFLTDEAKITETNLALTMIEHGPAHPLEAATNNFIQICKDGFNTQAGVHSISCLNIADQRGMLNLTPEQTKEICNIACQQYYINSITNTASELLIRLYKREETPSDIRDIILGTCETNAQKKLPRSSSRARKILSALDVKKVLEVDALLKARREEDLETFANDPHNNGIFTAKLSITAYFRFSK